MSNEVVGYARVSTSDQDVALQLDALRGAGVERIFKDVGSGSLKHRPQLDECLDRLRAGDTLGFRPQVCEIQQLALVAVPLVAARSPCRQGSGSTAARRMTPDCSLNEMKHG